MFVAFHLFNVAFLALESRSALICGTVDQSLPTTPYLVFPEVVQHNNIYFAKGQVNQKGKSPSNLATILEKKKNCATNI